MLSKMAPILETLNHLDGPQLVVIITQALTFMGVLTSAVGTFLISRQNAKGMKKMQEIKVEIDGRMAQLLVAHGEDKKKEGFLEGRLAERADPAIPLAKVLDIATTAKTGPTGPAGPVVIIRTPTALEEDDSFPPEHLKDKLNKLP